MYVQYMAPSYTQSHIGKRHSACRRCVVPLAEFSEKPCYIGQSASTYAMSCYCYKRSSAHNMLQLMTLAMLGKEG